MLLFLFLENKNLERIIYGELKNRERKGINTKRKIGKNTYEIVVHFNENSTEIMVDNTKGNAKRKRKKKRLKSL